MLKTYNNISGILNNIEDIPNDIEKFANTFRSYTSYKPQSIYVNSNRDIKSKNNTIKNSNISTNDYHNSSGSDFYNIVGYIKKYWWIPTILLVFLFLMNE